MRKALALTLLLVAGAAGGAQAGSYGAGPADRCAAASGHAARDRADPGRTAPTDAERAHIARCIAAAREGQAVLVTQPARLTPLCPPGAPVLYRGTLYCVGP